jgi:hypothetical protein
MSIQSERKLSAETTSTAASWWQYQNKFRGPAVLTVCLILISVVSCQRQYATRRAVVVVTPPPSVVRPLPPNASPQLKQFVEAAIEQSKVTTKSLPITNDRADYLPGDIVVWELSDGVEHIGILTNLSSEADKHYLIVHNIGAGARVEDVLLAWKIIGHYRYF